MDRDTFIITVFCLVSELYPQVVRERPVRRGGFAPALSDEEVITIEICGEYFKHHTEPIKISTTMLPLITATSFRVYQTGLCSFAKRLICGR